MRYLDQRQITGNQETNTTDDVRYPNKQLFFYWSEPSQHGIGRIEVKQQGSETRQPR